MEWFRFYSSSLDDPKVQRLPAELFKAWVNLLCLANEGDPRGTLPSLTDIAFRLRMSEEEAAAVLTDLENRNLIDHYFDNEMTPHNWEGRNPPSDSSTERVRRFRAKRSGNGEDAEDETLQQRSRNVIDKTRVDKTETRLEETRPEPRVRARDATWDALAAAAGSPATKSERADFKNTVDELDEIAATPDEIAAFSSWWYDRYPDAALTHRCYRSHFGKFRTAPPKPPPRPRNPTLQAMIANPDGLADIEAEFIANGSRRHLQPQVPRPDELPAITRGNGTGSRRQTQDVLPPPGRAGPR